MSIQSEIDRITGAVGMAYDAVAAKGGTVPQNETVAGLAAAVRSIPASSGGKEEEAVTVPLDMANGDQIVTPSEGKTLSKVTVTKPDDLSPSRVVLGSNIGGVDGNYFAPEIWVLNEEIVVPAKALIFTDLAFLTYAASDNNPDDPFPIQTSLRVMPRNGKIAIDAIDATGAYRSYLKRWTATSSGHYTDTNGWYGESAHPQIGRIIVFLRPPRNNNVDMWLQQNAVLYGSDMVIPRKKSLFELCDVDFAKVLSVTANGAYSIEPNAPYSMFGSATVNVNVPVPALQESKAVTITSNGTTNVTPDDGYDGMQSVAVTVNVAEEAALPVMYINSTEKEVKAIIWGKSYNLKAGTKIATPLDGNPNFPPRSFLDNFNIYAATYCRINLTKTSAAITIKITDN